MNTKHAIGRYIIWALAVALCVVILIGLGRVALRYVPGYQNQSSYIQKNLNAQAGLLSLENTATAYDPHHAYGHVVATYNDYIKGALVDNVILYSQSNDSSQATIERNGLLVHYEQAEATILMCHGFMCNKFDQGALRHLFPRGRYNLMTFDFRAHGDKIDGQSCTFGKDEAYDVIAAARFLKQHPATKDKPLFVYGFSMGAVSAIEAQKKDASLFQAMILDCPFDSSEKLLQRSLDRVKLSLFGYSFTMPWAGVLQKYAFHPYVQSLVKVVLKTVANLDPRHINVRFYALNPAESVKQISAPCLFIHCKNDEKISVDAIKSIYEGSAANYKVLWLTNGRNHFDSYFYSPERYTDKVRAFLDEAVAGTVYTVKKHEIIEDAQDRFVPENGAALKM